VAVLALTHGDGVLHVNCLFLERKDTKRIYSLCISLVYHECHVLSRTWLIESNCDKTPGSSVVHVSEACNCLLPPT
jgi:hypothetical protein